MDPDANYRELAEMIEEGHRSVESILAELDEANREPGASESKRTA